MPRISGTVVLGDDLENKNDKIYLNQWKVADADGGIGNDIVVGDNRNNAIWASVGDDILTGGFGTDTLVINGNYSSYAGKIKVSVDDQGNSVLLINGSANQTQDTGIDKISGFEKLQFNDQTLDIAPGALSDTDTSTHVLTEFSAAGTQVGIDLFSAANTTLATMLGSATPTYRFVAGGNPMGVFAIDATTGVVTVADPSALVMPNATLLSDGTSMGFRIIVESTFAGTVSEPVTFEIAITPVPGTTPDLPVDVDTTSDLVTENAATGTYTGITAHATDPDLGDTITYSLADNAGGRFQIDATTGVVTVLDGSAR